MYQKASYNRASVSCKAWKSIQFLCKGLTFACVCVVLFVMLAITVHAETRTVTYLENSDHELTIYFIGGKEDGKTIMIIGGIQGDEPGGYLAADMYADIKLKKGNLIVVPRANFYTIKKNKRGINGDMNRKFGPNNVKKNDYDSNIVGILKNLITRSDVLLNLHEGSGFYSPTYISNKRNTMRYGQSIIADANAHTHIDGKDIDLKGVALRVINEINRNINNPGHLFHFNNHNTSSDTTKHKEQRGSATYYALTVAGIPAFGLETSKSIKPIETKVHYQTLAINAFMKEYGVIPEHPSVSLPSPELDHLVVNIIGNSMPFAVKNGSTLTIPKNSSIQVMSIVANYKRGLSLDIEGTGNTNDLGRVASITGPTSIKVYKDAFLCGEIPIEITTGTNGTQNTLVNLSPPLHMEKLHIDIGNKNVVVSAGDTLHIVRGDIIRIVDAEIGNFPISDIRLNFVGFVGNKKFNDADDRGYYINTATALLNGWSINKSGTLFRIEALHGRKLIGTVYCSICEPEIHFLIVERDDGIKIALSPGDTFQCTKKEKLTVVSIISNITAEPLINTFISQKPDELNELMLPAVLDSASDFELRFRRTSLNLGTIMFRTDG